MLYRSGFMNIDWTPFFTSFMLIFLAELGDKTQICTIILSSNKPVIKVFLGAISAFFVVDGLSALVGGSLLNFIPHSIVSIICGLVFIVFGVLSFREKDDNMLFKDSTASFMNTFILISLMELGDKTQLTSILMAATFNNPITVLCGVMLAFIIITGISVIFGSKCLSLIPKKYLKIISSLTFIILGSIIIIEGYLSLNT